MFQLLLYLGSQWAFVSARTVNNWTRRASASKLFLIKGFPLCGLLPHRGLETRKFPCTEFFFISWGGHEGQQIWPPTKDVDVAVKATASSLDRDWLGMKIRVESFDCTFLLAISVQYDLILQKNPDCYYCWLCWLSTHRFLSAWELLGNYSNGARTKFKLVSLLKRELHLNSCYGENTKGSLMVTFRSGNLLFSYQYQYAEHGQHTWECLLGVQG